MKSARRTDEPQALSNKFQELMFQEYLQVILRGKWAILLAFTATLLVTSFYTFTAQRIYEATASVLIDTRGPEASVGAFGITGAGPGYNYLTNELEILKSRSLAERVAEKLTDQRYLDWSTRKLIPIIRSSEGEPPGWSVADSRVIADRLRGSVEFNLARHSDVIKITAISTDPMEAVLIANMFARAYYEGNVRASRGKSRAAREFLEGQLAQRKQELTKAEYSVQWYMERKGIVSLDEEASKLIDQLTQFEANRDALDVNIQSANKTLTSYQEQLVAQEPTVAEVIAAANDPYIRLLQEQLAQLEVQRDVTVAQNPNFVGQEIYTAKLEEVDEQIIALRKNLESRTGEFLESLLPGVGTSGQSADPAGYLRQVKQKIIELQIDIQAYEARKKALDEVISQYEGRFEQIPRKSIQFARLQRAKLSSEKLYLLVESKYNEAMIAEQSEFGYIDIIDPAVVSTDPVSPRTFRNLILGAIVGVMLGVGFVFVREYFNVRIRMPEDLKKRGFVMLSAIPVMNEEIRNLGDKGDGSTDGREIDTHLLSILHPSGQIAESYRWLRTNVQYAKLGRRLGAIAITSSNPKEGKTVTASNVAVVSAQAGKKVLLIDADLRRPSLHRQFDVNKEPGMCQVLFGETDLKKAVQETVVGNLHVLTCGTAPPNPSEILGSQSMRDLIRKAKRMYDLIIFDSSPVLAVSDSSVLSSRVDGIILVVSAGETRANALEGAFETLDGVGGKILGVVLNRFDLRKAYGGYYGYHHYRYAYYGYDQYGYGDQSDDGEEKGKTTYETQGPFRTWGKFVKERLKAWALKLFN